MRIAWLLLAALVTGCSAASAEDTITTDEQHAVEAVDAFWQENFPKEFGKPYESPHVAGPYIGTDGPTCGGQPSEPNNAFYCQPGDFLAWDENLMQAGYEQVGDAWVYLIIAHEWGHAIQARLNADQVSMAAELQADCLAGAALQGAVNSGSLTLEPGDAQELAQTLAAVADQYPWTNQSDHGNIQERTSAFQTGTAGGIQSCING